MRRAHARGNISALQSYLADSKSIFKNSRPCVSASVTTFGKGVAGILAWAWALSSIGAGDRVIIYQVE
jgi:hypothetical protein